MKKKGKSKSKEQKEKVEMMKDDSEMLTEEYKPGLIGASLLQNVKNKEKEQDGNLASIFERMAKEVNGRSGFDFIFRNWKKRSKHQR